MMPLLAVVESMWWISCWQRTPPTVMGCMLAVTVTELCGLPHASAPRGRGFGSAAWAPRMLQRAAADAARPCVCWIQLGKARVPFLTPSLKVHAAAAATAAAATDAAFSLCTRDATALFSCRSTACVANLGCGMHAGHMPTLPILPRPVPPHAMPRCHGLMTWPATYLGRLPSPAGLSHVAQYHAEIIAVGALRCECERMPRHAPCSIQAHVHHHRQHACCRRVVWGWRRPLLLLVVATAPSGTGSWGGGWRTQRSQDVACPLCMSAACEAAQHVRHVAEIAIARHAQQQVDAGAVGAVRCQVGSHLVNERLIAEVILGEVVGRCHCRHRVCRCRPPPPPLWAEG
eukprot:364429-Chlamydomonas_euryale.AAC.17